MFLMPKKKPSKTKFGENLSRIRAIRNMSQIELAQAINSTQRAVSSYETGECYPPLTVVTETAKVLKCSVDELLGLKQIKPLKEKTNPQFKRLWNQFQKILKLPEKDQRAIMRMVNSLTKEA